MASVLASFVYLVVGHSHHPGQSMEEAAMGAGICIVLATVAAVALLPTVPRPARLVQVTSAPTPHVRAVTRRVHDRARASPVWLQRFLR